MPPVSKCLWQFAGRVSDDLFLSPVVKRRKTKNKKKSKKKKGGDHVRHSKTQSSDSSVNSMRAMGESWLWESEL